MEAVADVLEGKGASSGPATRVRQALIAGLLDDEAEVPGLLAAFRSIRQVLLRKVAEHGGSLDECARLDGAVDELLCAVVEGYARGRDLVYQRAERRTKAITDNATLGLLLMDARQHCVLMNPAAEAITGLSLREVQGRPLHDCVHHTRPDGTPYPMDECPIDRALPEKNQTGGEEIFVRPDGSFYPVGFTASPLLEDGRPVGTVIELRDLTEQKRAEADRESLLQELHKAVQVRDEFLSIASHELRTPLTTLGLIADGLLVEVARAGTSPIPAERLRPRAQRVRTQVNRLETLVSQLLDVSRIVAGRLQVNPEPGVDLAAVAQDVVERFSDAAARAGVTLDLVRHGTPVGRWDWLRLDQVLTNLVSNAIKYGAGKPVRVQIASEGEHAVITVQDQGIGVAREDQARIFDRFERAVSGQNYGGLGLGLWITREVVLAMNGTISVNSAPGQGAVFTVRLPR